MRRHDLDPVSLGLGLLFAVIGLLFLVVRTSPGGLHASALWPAPVIALGALIVGLSVRGALAKGHRSGPDGPP